MDAIETTVTEATKETVNFLSTTAKKIFSNLLFVIALVITFAGGYVAHTIVASTIPVNTTPKSFSTISTAINEHKELVIMEKSSSGYSVSLVLSDSVTTAVFNMISSQIYNQNVSAGK